MRPWGPVGPVRPVEPVRPCGPVGPVRPCGPVSPTGPWGPMFPPPLFVERRKEPEKAVEVPEVAVRRTTSRLPPDWATLAAVFWQELLPLLIVHERRVVPASVWTAKVVFAVTLPSLAAARFVTTAPPAGTTRT